jgi:UDP-N-acetylmuramoylalanine--D-glutamate ligase
MEFHDKKIAVLGFAIEGQAMTDLLVARGAQVTVFDDKEINSDLRQAYEAQSVSFHTGPFGDLTQFDYISRTPGIRLDRVEIVQAQAAGVPIISNTKLFLDEAKGVVVGVTGTKGKGTTSQLLFNIVSSARDTVFLGGNIGQSPLKFLPQLNDQSITILELSSFQLADVTKSPQLSVVLMVTSEHLDYHKTVEEYVEAKAGITKFQSESDTVIYNADYPATVKIAEQSKGRKLKVVSLKLEEGDGCFVKNDQIVVRLNSLEEIIMSVNDIGLVGRHNWENVCAAIMAAKVLGIDNEHIVASTRAFKGLEHRLEFVREVEGVRYYNDSISTTPESAIAAIRAFDQPKILILGGSSKHSDFTELGTIIKNSHSIKAIIGIGDEWNNIKQSIGQTQIPLIEDCQTMPEIIGAAQKLVVSGDVVILSPACASFGLFQDYKDRGKQFKEVVEKL